MAAAVLVALLILAPTVMAQGTTQGKMEQTTKLEKPQPLPSSGGLSMGWVLVPAAALLVGTGVLAYALLRRR